MLKLIPWKSQLGQPVIPAKIQTGHFTNTDLEHMSGYVWSHSLLEPHDAGTEKLTPRLFAKRKFSGSMR
jgi:hypothetical protein